MDKTILSGRLLLSVILLSFTSCGSDSSRIELFDSVWQTIYTSFPDSSIVENNWVSIGDKYREMVLTASTGDQAIDLLNDMLFELNVSHAFIGRISEIEEKASPYMFRPGSPGFDVRILEGQVVVVEVDVNSSVVKTGLSAGSTILKINDRSVGDILLGAPNYPPYNERYGRFLQTEEILRHLYGDVGSTVTIEYQSVAGKTSSEKIRRIKRAGEFQLSVELPPVYLDCQWSVMHDDIGYLRFNAFQPEYPEDILSALDSLRSTSALVIDLRGNNGGSLEAQRHIASQLLAAPVIGATIETRNRVDTLIFEGHDGAYAGPIAILVDEVSISGAELFAATLRSLDRAVIVGSQTPGAVMGGAIEFLCDSLVLIHPTLRIRTIGGLDLEGVGVTPDIFVPLQQYELAEGVDGQLLRAVEILLRANVKREHRRLTLRPNILLNLSRN